MTEEPKPLEKEDLILDILNYPTYVARDKDIRSALAWAEKEIDKEFVRETYTRDRGLRLSRDIYRRAFAAILEKKEG